ncbi:MAG: peptide ABC transporter ATP-binding protein, partial [Opitutae bacterium]|nr:peptide ABC transporter ATP-binding protein [Opitutae bacterium]
MSVEDQSEPLLEIRDLSVSFEVDEGEVQALDGVSLEVTQGQTLGLVGESGCGKSVTALSVMRLLPKPMGKILSGRISFEGKDLLKLSPEEIREVRGNEVGMIFQEPMNALNPVKKIGVQLSEVYLLHQNLP